MTPPGSFKQPAQARRGSRNTVYGEPTGVDAALGSRRPARCMRARAMPGAGTEFGRRKNHRPSPGDTAVPRTAGLSLLVDFSARGRSGVAGQRLDRPSDSAGDCPIRPGPRLGQNRFGTRKQRDWSRSGRGSSGMQAETLPDEDAPLVSASGAKHGPRDEHATWYRDGRPVGSIGSDLGPVLAQWLRNQWPTHVGSNEEGDELKPCGTRRHGRPARARHKQSRVAMVGFAIQRADIGRGVKAPCRLRGASTTVPDQSAAAHRRS